MRYAKTPCGRCGWKFETFHVCLDLPPDVMQRVEDGTPPKPKRKTYRDPRSDAIRGTDEWRANLSAARQRRTERERAHNRERDREIARRYSQDERTIRELCVEFQVSNTTIIAILHRARDEGELVIRPAAKRIRS